MTTPSENLSSPTATLTEAEWYDLSIDWDARIRREIPVLMGVFGPPGGGGILDAGCGTGHQVAALSQRGYRVVGADLNEEMLEVARRTARAAGTNPTFTCTPYADLLDATGGGFDGVYCLANSLAAAETPLAVRQAVHRFAECLRPGGRTFIQVLNFAPLRKENPCLRGPRVTRVNGVEYVSVRNFVLMEDYLQVINITFWNDSSWRFHSHGRRLYPVALAELQSLCSESSLRVDATWGSYAKEPFDAERSGDLILVATKI